MHGEFLTMSGTKMSKRFGNILTARDLREEGVDAGTVRLLFATTHYRAPLDFTDQALDAAREGSRRLGAFGARLAAAGAGGNSPALDAVATELDTAFTEAMNDDLNAPRALAALFDAAREGNRLLDAGELPGPTFQAVWARTTDVLQVLPLASGPRVVTMADARDGLEESGGDDDWAAAWAGRRLAAKHARDWPEADRIRDLLTTAGWEVRDRKDGSAEVVRAGG
jgi:cysteinyl-tRNA synthetase